MKRYGLLIAVLCLFDPAGAFARQAPQSRAIDPQAVVEAKIGEKLDDYLSRLEAFGFCGAVVYAKKDRVFLRKAYGYASRAEDVPNTTETLFDIASVTKQFTCAGILRLQMQGKLSTDDPVTKFLPILGEDKSGILLYHLMTNTSGLSSRMPVSEETKDREEFLEIVRDSPTEADPGAGFVYNNLNFALLAAVIEVVSGKKYETFMREQVFEPAGMKTVHFLGEPIRNGVETAMAHRGDWELWHAEEAWYSWALRGAAGTLCSINDLYRWELALRGDAVLSRESRLELFNRFVPSYTYGWFVRDYIEPKRTVFWHGGNTIGFQAHFERCPKDGSVIIVLINDADKIEPISGGVRALIENTGLQIPPKPVVLPKEALDNLAREYLLEKEQPIRLTEEKGALVLRDYGLAAVGVRLKGRSEADVKRAPRYDTRADEAMQAWHVGDMEPLRGLFPENREQLADKFAFEWGALMEAGGGLKGVRVLGTIPESIPILHTFVAMSSNERTEVIKLTWHNGDLVAWDHTYPGVMRFVPLGDNEFISYEITDEITPRDRAMKFVFDEQGQPTTIAILIDFKRLFGEPVK